MQIKSMLMISLLFIMSQACYGAACDIRNTLVVDFASYNPFATQDNDSAGDIKINCIGIALLTIEISAGASGQINQRKMFSNNEALNYNLYSNAGRTTIWNTLRTLVIGNRIFTIYGRIPAGQDVRPGVYTDNPTVTLYF